MLWETFSQFCVIVFFLFFFFFSHFVKGFTILNELKSKNLAHALPQPEVAEHDKFLQLLACCKPFALSVLSIVCCKKSRRNTFSDEPRKFSVSEILNNFCSQLGSKLR